MSQAKVNKNDRKKIDSSLSLQEQGSKKEEVVEGLLVEESRSGKWGPGREGGLVACLCW